MTIRSQKRKAVAELVSVEFDASSAENSQTENYVSGPSKSRKVQSEKLDEIITFLRKKIISDQTMVLAENQKEIIKLIAPAGKKNQKLPKTWKTLILNLKLSSHIQHNDKNKSDYF